MPKERESRRPQWRYVEQHAISTGHDRMRVEDASRDKPSPDRRTLGILLHPPGDIRVTVVERRLFPAPKANSARWYDYCCGASFAQRFAVGVV